VLVLFNLFFLFMFVNLVSVAAAYFGPPHVIDDLRKWSSYSGEAAPQQKKQQQPQPQPQPQPQVALPHQQH
jgi:hypothetical protein